jgi:hypothetical protein
MQWLWPVAGTKNQKHNQRITAIPLLGLQTMIRFGTISLIHQLVAHPYTERSLAPCVLLMPCAGLKASAQKVNMG